MDFLKDLKTLQNKFENKFETYVNKIVLSEIEQKLEEATSNEHCHANVSLLDEIASRAGDYQDFNLILNHIEKKLQLPKDKWRRILKTLFLVEHLVRVGSNRTIDSISQNSYLIKNLVNFRYEDEKRNDKGGSIREKASFIISLLDDSDKLAEEKESYKGWKDRIAGVSNKGGVSSVSSTSGGGHFGGVSSSNYNPNTSSTNNRVKKGNQTYTNYDPTKFKKTEIRNGISDSESDDDNKTKKRKKKQEEFEEKPKAKVVKETKFEREEPTKPTVNSNLFHLKNPGNTAKSNNNSNNNNFKASNKNNYEEDEFEEVEETNTDKNNNINALGDIFSLSTGTTNTNENKNNNFNNDIFSIIGNSNNNNVINNNNDVFDFSKMTITEKPKENVIDNAPKITTEELLSKMNQPSQQQQSNSYNQHQYNQYSQFNNNNMNNMFQQQQGNYNYNNKNNNNMNINSMNNMNMGGYYNNNMNINMNNMNSYNNYGGTPYQSQNKSQIPLNNKPQEKIKLNYGTLKPKQSEDDEFVEVKETSSKGGLSNLLDSKLVNLDNLGGKKKY